MPTDTVSIAERTLLNPMSELNPVRRKRLVIPPSAPTLRFSPTAWAKLLYLRDRGDTEVGGFAISPPDDLLFASDIRLVRQATTSVSVKFDDMAVAEFFDEQVDAGLRPEQFARIWVHTHPGDSPHPSSTDEQTFARVFGRSDWAIMFILARGGQTYARLRFNVGPGGAVMIPVAVDYSQPFSGSDHKAWDEEYARHVAPEFLADVVERTPSQVVAEERAVHEERDGFSEFWPDPFEDLAFQTDPDDRENLW